MRKIYVLVLLILGISCDDTSDILGENFERGGLVVWETVPESFRLDFLQIETIVFSNIVEDPNNNIISYSLQMMYKDIVVDDFITITSFPTNLDIAGQEILNALNITAEEFDLTASLQFVATITTENGVFSAVPTDFDAATNTNNGGQGGPELYDNPAFNQAIRFSLSFFIPRPPKIRGTSFEEPFGTGAGGDYFREPGDEDLTAELLNRPGERNVQYTAQGTGKDDEIGFSTFYESFGSSGFLNEEIGVSTRTNAIGSFTDGVQGFQIEDPDGIIKVVFDRVAVSAPQSGVEIQFFPGETGWEDSDYLTISALVERGEATETVVLVDLLGDADIEGQLTGKWNIATTDLLDNVTAYTLTIEFASGTNTEVMYFDQMLVFLPR